MPTRHTLISTVGNSLFEGSLPRLAADSSQAVPDRQPILQAWRSGEWKGLADRFAGLDPLEKICGAEINTVEEVRKKKELDLENVVFLVSDTTIGRNTGRFLRHYFRKRADLKLRNIEIHVVERLQDSNPHDFRIHGLRNLVRAIGKYVGKFGGPEYAALNATGGYKAQIAIAVIVGQAMDIPVFYKHEKFTDIISFPPLPVTFDHELLAANADLLYRFEQGEIFSSEEIGRVDEKLRVLLTEVEIDGQLHYELNPVGQVYLTGFRIRNPRPPALVPAGNRKPPSFGNDHHLPRFFKSFVNRVWAENNWIITAWSVPYNKQKSLKRPGFKVIQEGETYLLTGIFRGSDFSGRFRLRITDDSHKAMAWAADYLNRKYSPGP